MTSITFAAVIWDADESSVKDCAGSRVSYNVTSGNDSTFILLIFWFSLRILVMTDVLQRSKVSWCFQNNLLFAPYFVQLPGWNCFELLSFLVHCCFRLSELIYEPNCSVSLNFYLCLRCDLHDLSAEMIAMQRTKYDLGGCECPGLCWQVVVHSLEVDLVVLRRVFQRGPFHWLLWRGLWHDCSR